MTPAPVTGSAGRLRSAGRERQLPDGRDALALDDPLLAHSCRRPQVVVR